MSHIEGVDAAGQHVRLAQGLYTLRELDLSHYELSANGHKAQIRFTGLLGYVQSGAVRIDGAWP